MRAARSRRVAHPATVTSLGRGGLPRKVSVLLIEPDPDNQDMYAEYLCAHAFDVVTREDGCDAIAHAQSADVVVTGIRLPGEIDGITLIRQLRADARTKLKPIIVLTACAYDADRRRAQQAGCDAFLPKPCLPDALMAEIRQVLQLRLVSHAPMARAGCPPLPDGNVA
jgi:two-component system cell cycle response regulator DivK